MKQDGSSSYKTSYGIRVLRTNEHLFDNVDYPFKSHYVFVNEIRMHYIDENSTSERVIVLLHGQPTWGYLYRKIIPLLAKAGYRVIVPDLIGYGKSDKPAHKRAYSYSQNVKWMSTFLFDKLKLDQVNFVLHDWGGLIGLRIVAEQSDKFKSVIAMNTAFPRLEGINFIFMFYRFFIEVLVLVPVSKMVNLNIKSNARKEELKAYDYPFIKYRSRTAARTFPKLIPIFPWQKEAKTNKMLWKKLCDFKQPFTTLFTNKDPFTKRCEEDFIRCINGAKDQPHEKLKDIGHFIQEEDPVFVSNYIIRFLSKQVYSKA